MCFFFRPQTLEMLENTLEKSLNSNTAVGRVQLPLSWVLLRIDSYTFLYETAHL